MATHKVVATVTWHFESSADVGAALEQAKSQLDAILKTDAAPPDGFGVQLSVVRRKDRNRLVHLGSFEPDDVFPHITVEHSKHTYEAGGRLYEVRMNSDRYHLFRDNRSCVACGLTGSKLVLEMDAADGSPHFNFYAEERGRLVLMTKDHILPKSRGGPDAAENYRVLCQHCNQIRGNCDLTHAQIRELRRLYLDNPDRLPRKELRALINNLRETMHVSNGEGHDDQRNDQAADSGTGAGTQLA